MLRPKEEHQQAPSVVKTRKLGKRGTRPVIGKMPVRNKYVKHKISPQESVFLCCAASDDLVGDFLTGC